MYYMTGRQLGPISIPHAWCRECDLTVRTVSDVVQELPADAEPTFAAKPWLRHLFEALGRGGWHPPVVVIEGDVFSQGVVPDSEALRERLLELVSEFAKIISFGFRLFGNIFAGALLLAILGALTVVIVPSMLYGLEFFVGIIQAYVFSMLALTFMSQAIVSHHGDEHDAEHGHGEHAAEAAR